MVTRVWWKRRQARRHCPHSYLTGIYGDEVNRTPGGRRLRCVACGALVDGPVTLAAMRVRERRPW